MLARGAVADVFQIEAQKEQISNEEYLKLFLDAKKITSCSERTIQYYRVTVERLLQTVDTPCAR